MATRQAKRLTIVVAICLSCVTVLCLLAGLEIVAWWRLRNRLGIEPTPAALDEYLHTVIIEGMSREQVHRELNLIARNITRPLASKSTITCETVFFSIGPIPILEPGYDICYALNGKLIKFSTVY